MSDDLDRLLAKQSLTTERMLPRMDPPAPALHYGYGVERGHFKGECRKFGSKLNPRQK